MDILNVRNENGEFQGIPAIRGERGPKGDQGLSAYEIAVKHGYSGTEKEWLELLELERQNAVTSIRDAGYNIRKSLPNDYVEMGDRVSQLSESITEISEEIDHLPNGDVLNIQRMFRYPFLFESDYNHGQCITFTGNSFVSGGSSNNNTTQCIFESDINGNPIEGRTKILNDERLGHLNDMQYHNGKLYCCGTGYICVVDYETLEIESAVRIAENEYSIESLYGISLWNDEVYVVGAPTITPYSPCIFKFNMDTGRLEKVCQFDELETKIQYRPVKQGMYINEGYAYCVYNWDNNILKVDLETGDVKHIYIIPNGDRYYPVGEIENVLFIDGQMYVYSSVFQFGRKDKAFSQLFKTNLGGACITSSNYGQAEENYVSLYVDGDSEEVNPSGTAESPFSSIEEACLVYHYRRNETNVDKFGIIVNGGYEKFENEYVYLLNCSVNMILGAAKVKRVELRNCDGLLQNFTSEELVLSSCNLVIANFSTDDLYAIGSSLNVNGYIGGISKLERTSLNFMKSNTEETADGLFFTNDVEVENFSNSSISGSTGRFNFDGVNTTPHATEGTDKYTPYVPLKPLHKAKLKVFNGYDTICIRVLVGISGGYYNTVYFRFPTNLYNRLLNGEEVTATASSIIFNGAAKAYVGIALKCGMSLENGIRFSVQSIRNLISNEYIRYTVYFYDITFVNANVDIM